MAYKIQAVNAACCVALFLGCQITHAKEPTELNFDTRNAYESITNVITNQSLLVVLGGKTTDCPDTKERIADAAASVPNLTVIFAERKVSKSVDRRDNAEPTLVVNYAFFRHNSPAYATYFSTFDACKYGDHIAEFLGERLVAGSKIAAARKRIVELEDEDHSAFARLQELAKIAHPSKAQTDEANQDFLIQLNSPDKIAEQQTIIDDTIDAETAAAKKAEVFSTAAPIPKP